MMERSARIYVAGHRGLVGSALVRRLEQGGYNNILVRTHAELDLLDQAATHAFLAQEKPDFIFIAAATVGGINANNSFRADFIYQNLIIEANLIHGAWLAGVKRLCFLGSSCIYPRDCPQPIKEEYLLGGPLEQTNEPYAIAKIAGIKLCESYNRQYGTGYFSAMPTNLYGPNDHYDLASSHVLPALIRKAHEAKQRGDREFAVWGSGTPRREFLYVDDLADACTFLMEREIADGMYNIGTGEDVTIRELAEIGDVGYGLFRPDRVRRQQAGRNAAQAAGRQSHGRTWLAGEHPLARRNFFGVPGFHDAIRRSAMSSPAGVTS
jgi:GDP-L-fucose synthase